LWGIGLFLVCLTVEENAGMPKIYKFVIDYERPRKKGNVLLETI
jgi:hypothetical protein